MDNYLNRQKWINEGGVLFPIPGSATLLTTPGDGVFRIYVDARTGRIRYVKQFGNLELSVINEVIEDALEDKSLACELIKLVNSLEISTIDILKSLIEECNITGRIPDPNLFNVPLSKLKLRLLRFSELDEDCFEEVKRFIVANKPESMPIEQWLDRELRITPIISRRPYGRLADRKSGRRR